MKEETRDRLGAVVAAAGAALVIAFLLWGIYLNYVDGQNRVQAETEVVKVVRESGLEQLEFRGHDGLLRDAYRVCPKSEGTGAGDLLAGDPDESYPEPTFDGPLYPHWFSDEWIATLKDAVAQTQLCEYADDSEFAK